MLDNDVCLDPLVSNKVGVSWRLSIKYVESMLVYVDPPSMTLYLFYLVDNVDYAN